MKRLVLMFFFGLFLAGGLHAQEKEPVRFVRGCGFPVEGSPCPSGLASKRSKKKDVLRAPQKESRPVEVNLLHAVQLHGSPDSP